MTLLVLLHFSTGTPSGSRSTPWDLSVRVLLLWGTFPTLRRLTSTFLNTITDLQSARIGSLLSIFSLKGFRSFSPTSGTSASTSPTQSGSTSCLASSQCSTLKCGTCTSSGVIEVLISRSLNDDNLIYQFDIFYPGARSLVLNSTSPTSRNPIRIC